MHMHHDSITSLLHTNPIPLSWNRTCTDDLHNYEVLPIGNIT